MASDDLFEQFKQAQIEEAAAVQQLADYLKSTNEMDHEMLNALRKAIAAAGRRTIAISKELQALGADGE